jgi:RNA polymerase sigma-B factor
VTPARIAMTHLLPPRPAARPHHPAARRRSAVSARRPDLLDLSDAELVGLLRDPSQCADAKEALVLRYEPMVRALAYEYRLPAQYYEDLIQVGYLGLLKAISNFDPSVCEELGPYARVCVSGEIKRFFRDKRWAIRVSRSDQELLVGARRARDELTQELGRIPGDEQVAERLGISVVTLRQAYQASDAFAPGSLDAPLSAADEREPGDLIGFDDLSLERTIDMAAVSAHWNELGSPEQQVLLMRYYGNMTQEQIAQRLGCSQMQISRIQARALAFLRQRLLAD